MKRIIYYYSGTGNSLRAAMKIAKNLGGAEVVSVRSNPEEVPSTDYDVIGFVTPVYEWDIPNGMKEFIEKVKVNKNAYIFAVCTCIFVSGKSYETIEKILNNKGTSLTYGRTLKCVASACFAYPPFPPEKIMTPITERNIDKISKEIKCKLLRRYPKESNITNKLYPKLVKPFAKLEKNFDKGFYTSDNCVGCEVCKNVCPVNNITFKDNHPVWNHKCNSCMSCVVYCPKKAIQFKKPEEYEKSNHIMCKIMGLPEKRKRYHNPYISAKDIVKNKQFIK